MTAVALGNPLRQGSEVYDDLTKDYFGQNSVIKEDSNGTGTQISGMRYGDDLLGLSLSFCITTPFFGTICFGTPAPDQNARPRKPRTREEEEACDRACQDEMDLCLEEASLLDISGPGSGCYGAEAQCEANGGVFINPGWRVGLGHPPRQRVWPYRAPA